MQQPVAWLALSPASRGAGVQQDGGVRSVVAPLLQHDATALCAVPQQEGDDAEPGWAASRPHYNVSAAAPSAEPSAAISRATVMNGPSRA